MIWLGLMSGKVTALGHDSVRQFKAEGLSDELFAGTPDTIFIKDLLTKAASCKDFGLLVVDISVAFMHARTDEEIFVKVL